MMEFVVLILIALFASIGFAIVLGYVMFRVQDRRNRRRETCEQYGMLMGDYFVKGDWDGLERTMSDFEEFTGRRATGLRKILFSPTPTSPDAQNGPSQENDDWSQE